MYPGLCSACCKPLSLLFLSFFHPPRRKVGSALIIVNQTREWCASRGGGGGEGGGGGLCKLAHAAIIVEIAENDEQKNGLVERSGLWDREISTDRITTQAIFSPAAPTPPPELSLSLVGWPKSIGFSGDELRNFSIFPRSKVEYILSVR